jgi:hypothetical protein
MKVLNSSSAPKDKPYYIIIGQGTPQQQMYLIEPPSQPAVQPSNKVIVPAPKPVNQLSNKVIVPAPKLANQPSNNKVIVPNPQPAVQPSNKVIVPAPNLFRGQSESNIIAQPSTGIKGQTLTSKSGQSTLKFQGQTPNKLVFNHTPGKSLLQSDVGSTVQHPKPGSEQLPTTGAQSVIDLTDTSVCPERSQMEGDKVVHVDVPAVEEKNTDGKLSCDNTDTVKQSDKSSAEKPNRFYKFCSISDPRNTNSVTKTPHKPQEPATPVLFGGNSQEEEEEHKEATKTSAVSTTSRKPLFRKTRKDSSKELVDTVQVNDSDEEFKSTRQSTEAKEVEVSPKKRLKDSESKKGASEKEEACHLRTRRGPRGQKRISAQKPNLRVSKRKKGVEFVEDEEDCKENQVNRTVYVNVLEIHTTLYLVVILYIYTMCI